MSVLYCWRHCFNESHVKPQQRVWLAADRTVCSLSFLSCLRGHGHKQAFISVTPPPPPSSTTISITQKNVPVNSATVKTTVSKAVKSTDAAVEESQSKQTIEELFKSSDQISLLKGDV